MHQQKINQFHEKQRGLFEKPAFPQIVKKFLTFYGTRKFIAAFRRARQLFLL
jgi:hypothetical protein